MKTAVVLGTFDGLHSGHRAVIAAADGFYSIAVTFRIPPKTLKKPELLMMPESRRQALLELGISEVAMYEFGDLCGLTANQFFEFLRLKYNPTRIVCGYNYRFGKNAVGDTKLLKEYCEAAGVELVCVDEVTVGNEPVSSTKIRGLIKDGEIYAANALLYKSFGFSATVISGDKRGRELGFPTINQQYPELLTLTRFGVYESRVTVGDKVYIGITNIGIRPTFKTEKVFSETYIKDFSGDLYGAMVKIELVRFVRDEKRFENETQLRAAIADDAAKIFGE